MLNESPKPCWSILSRLTTFEVLGAFICLDRSSQFRLMLAPPAQADHGQSLRAVQATSDQRSAVTASWQLATAIRHPTSDLWQLATGNWQLRNFMTNDQ